MSKRRKAWTRRKVLIGVSAATLSAPLAANAQFGGSLNLGGTQIDLGNIFSGLGVELDRIVVNDMEEGTYYARIILKMENELGKKIIELDARPSDSMVLALQAKKPIFITRKVLDASDDMTEILERILKQQN